MTKPTLVALILTLPAALFCIWVIATAYEYAMNKPTKPIVYSRIGPEIPDCGRELWDCIRYAK